jgi:hypothetical protein
MPGILAFWQATRSPRRQGSQIPQCPPYQPRPTRWPTFHGFTSSPMASMTPMTSWPGTRGYWIGKIPSLVMESLWQTPQAWTRMRTWKAGGSGTGRSTSSNAPPALGTCAARIFLRDSEVSEGCCWSLSVIVVPFEAQATHAVMPERGRGCGSVRWSGWRPRSILEACTRSSAG